jgi:hypothetical protein
VEVVGDLPGRLWGAGGRVWRGGKGRLGVRRRPREQSSGCTVVQLPPATALTKTSHQKPSAAAAPGPGRGRGCSGRTAQCPAPGTPPFGARAGARRRRGPTAGRGRRGPRGTRPRCCERGREVGLRHFSHAASEPRFPRFTVRRRGGPRRKQQGGRGGRGGRDSRGQVGAEVDRDQLQRLHQPQQRAGGDLGQLLLEALDLRVWIGGGSRRGGSSSAWR